MPILEQARLNLDPGYSTKASGQVVDLRATTHEELLTVQGLPRYTENSRRGIGWQTMATSAVAALVVRPSTTAALELFNNNVGGSNVCLIIDRLFTHNLVAVANSAFGIYAMVTTVKAAPSTASLVVTGNTGKGYGGQVINAVSTTVVANGWYPYGPYGATVTVTTPGATTEALVEGRLIVPPQCSLCLHVVASTTSATFTTGASWYEEVITLG